MSVVVSTRNRADVLKGAIARLLSQRTSLPHEIILVDNNSSDSTPDVIGSAVERRPDLIRHGFEGRTGVSHGRNKGIELSRAPVVAFTDDDVLVEPDWLSRIAAALRRHPEVDCVGGRVLPVWKDPPPAWLTRQHWSPLALVDYGEKPFYVDQERPVCLVTANVAYRRSALDAIGWFAPEFTRCQDHELLLRLWRAGRRGRYLPSLIVRCEVPTARLTWSYHQFWHSEHGRFLAQMPDDGAGGPAVRTSAQLFGAPAASYRELVASAVRWQGARLAGRPADARAAEVLFHQKASFVTARARLWKQHGNRGVIREMLRFLCTWLVRYRGRRMRAETERLEQAT